MEKEVLAATPVTAIAAMFEMAAKQRAVSLLAATLELRSDQTGSLKGIKSTLGLKTVRFYNDIIIIRKLNDIEILDLNDKAVISRVATLKVL